MEFTAEMIAGFLGGEISGNKDAKVWTISKIEEGADGSLCFLSNPKYEPHIYTSKASIVIVNRDFTPQQEVTPTLIKVDDAYGCFAKLLELYAANKPRKKGISDSASISKSAKLGDDCYVGEYAVICDQSSIGDGCSIYPQVYIGDRVRIGKNVTLHPGVKIYEDCAVGDNVTIHAGAVIGADGFGFAPNAEGGFDKIPQLGNVIIGNNVDIGANTCVDRATMGSTFIHDGVKLDNLIQVGHNAVVGRNTVAAAQVGIAGSTKVGESCMLGGQVGLAGHITLGNGVQVGSKAGVSNSIKDGEVHMGYPSMPVSKHHRAFAIYRNLPQLSADVHQMKKDLATLKNAKE